MAKIRLADIAKEVGVSTVTVHNALSGNKGVSEEVKIKIQKIADEMGYQPLSSLKEKNRQEKQITSYKIGVLIAENYLAQYSTFYWKMYQELALIATEKRCFTTVEVLNKIAEKKTFSMPQCIEEQTVDGIIIIGEIDKLYIEKMRQVTKVPIVFLDFYNKDLAKDAVIADSFYGMYLMTELLFKNGYENIGFLGSIYATSSIMDRYCGYQKSMMEHRKSIQPEWIIEDRDELGKIDFDLPKKLPEAFVCNCDLSAGYLIEKLNERGYRVPEDIAVVGFDNYLCPGFADLKITTYEVNTRAMSKVALNKILKRIKNPEASQGLEIVSGKIVVKNTVKMRKNR